MHSAAMRMRSACMLPRWFWAVASKSWVVFSKRPFAGASQLYAYLARYTHRVGLSDHRLLAVDDEAVTWKTRGDGTATAAPVEFIRRLLQHVLPQGFVKIRHAGLYAASNVNTRLARARALLVDESSPVVERTFHLDAILAEVLAMPIANPAGKANISVGDDPNTSNAIPRATAPRMIWTSETWRRLAMKSAHITAPRLKTE